MQAEQEMKITDMAEIILEKRAISLAKEIEQEDTDTDYIDIVEFGIGNEWYGIQYKNIKQIIYLKEITPLPGLAPHFVGVTGNQEQIITVLDIGMFLGFSQFRMADKSKLLIISLEDIIFGIPLNDVRSIKSVKISSIQKLLATLTEKQAKYFYGLTSSGTVILDDEKVIRDIEKG